MLTGTVKWFNNAKGYGFIVAENNPEDFFAHFSSIEMDGYKTLKAGQKVTFEIEKADRGFHAKHIRVMNQAPEAAGKENSPQALVATG